MGIDTTSGYKVNGKPSIVYTGISDSFVSLFIIIIPIFVINAIHVPSASNRHLSIHGWRV